MLIVAPKRQKEVIRTFGDYNFLWIPRFKLHVYSLLLYDPELRDLGEGYPDILCGTIYSKRMVESPGRNLIEKTRSFYGLPATTPIKFHGTPPRRVTAIPDFYSHPEKVVLLNTHSNSYWPSGETLRRFEAIARGLAGAGYRVYSNVVRDQPPLPGTAELRCSLPELLEIAAHIPFIVSVRSGVLDFLVKTDVPMFAVYSGDEGRDMYTLTAWGRSGTLAELTEEEFLGDTEYRAFRDFYEKAAPQQNFQKTC